jgi:endonuclease YncB( thermonuclease family)
MRLLPHTKIRASCELFNIVIIMGTLKIIGQIELKQFWPEGLSDADTSNILVSVDNDSFFYRKDNQSPYRKTKVFNAASVIGKTRAKLIKNNKIKVRFQGIDAPELHYKAPPLQNNPDVTPALRAEYNEKNKSFRQNLSESATFALRKFLRSINKNVVNCQVLSHNVEKPREVVDTYGRFVANVNVKQKTKTIDLNVWLAKEGWVVPTFYTSMSEDEMAELLSAAKKGKKKNRIWKYLRTDTGKFKYSLQFRKNVTEFNLGDDNAILIMPKLFRRQVSYEMQKKVGLFTGEISEFLTKSKDPFYKTEDFFLEGFDAKLYYIDEFFNGKKFQLGPGDLVFREKYSNIIDENGEFIVNW